MEEMWRRGERLRRRVDLRDVRGDSVSAMKLPFRRLREPFKSIDKQWAGGSSVGVGSSAILRLMLYQIFYNVFGGVVDTIKFQIVQKTMRHGWVQRPNNITTSYVVLATSATGRPCRSPLANHAEAAFCRYRSLGRALRAQLSRFAEYGLSVRIYVKKTIVFLSNRKAIFFYCLMS